LTRLVPPSTDQHSQVAEQYGRLSPPPSNTGINKRKSSHSLSTEFAQKRKDFKQKAVQSKDHWVHKQIRQTSRYYCCHCEQEQALTNGRCQDCEHETTDCLECLAERTSKSKATQKHQVLSILGEEKQRALDATSLPQNSWTLADIELQQDDDSITSFALSGNFPLFSADTITKMQSFN
jgi:hypothetical protein